MNFYKMGSFILFNSKICYLYIEGDKGGKEMAMYNPYQANQFFPQPQGNVYIVSSSMETVHKCIWEEAHETLREWHNKVERKIKSY